MESKKYNKLVNKTKRSRLTDPENKLAVTGGEGEGQYRVGSLRHKLLGVGQVQGRAVQQGTRANIS